MESLIHMFMKIFISIQNADLIVESNGFQHIV